MSDQQTAATEQQPADNPETGAGTQQDTQQIPSGYVPESQYNELRGWSTREAQWRSQHEATVSLVEAAQNGDEDAQRQLLTQLGYELPEEDSEEFYGEPDPRIAARLAKVDELEQQWNAMTEQQREQANYEGYRAQYDPELEQMGVPQPYHDLVAQLAYEAPAIQTPQGPVPDLEGVWNDIRERLLEPYLETPAAQTKVKKSWQRTKPSAAVTQPGGVQATHIPQLNSRADRAAFISQQVAQLDADDSAGA